MTYKEFIKNYDKYEKPASTFYHKYVPKKIAKLISYPLYKIGIAPNLISSFSFFLLLSSIAFLYFNEDSAGIFIFFVLSLLSYSLDCVDGVLARITNKSSDFGGFYDLFLDRLGEAVLYYILFLHFLTNEIITSYYLISISLLVMFYYRIASILRSFKLKKLDGTMKKTKKSLISLFVAFLYEFIDTGTFYFLLTLSLLFNFSEILVIFYGFISFLLTLGVLLFSFSNK